MLSGGFVKLLFHYGRINLEIEAGGGSQTTSLQKWPNKGPSMNGQLTENAPGLVKILQVRDTKIPDLDIIPNRGFLRQVTRNPFGYHIPNQYVYLLKT